MYMPLSPGRHQIQHVEGDASEIIARGTAIEELGGQMRDSADVLKDIKTRASDQQGKAIDSLRESIGDSYTVLYQAADLYEPVGPVIRTYGEALEEVKPKIDGHADECETLWTTYVNTDGHIPPRGSGGFLQPDEDSDEAKQNAEEDAAKQKAYDAWEEEAEAFDRDYDTWERAFDTAVENIGEKMADQIKDSFWDNWGDFITEFLSWASLILGIAALIIGGPIVAALAALAALAYLAVTVYEYSQGKKSLLDVGLAALGVLPVGKLANLTKVLHFTKPAMKAAGKSSLGNFGKLKGLFSKPALGDGLLKTFKNKGTSAGLKQLFTGSTSFKSVYRTHKSFHEGPGAALALVRNGSAVRNLAAIDYSLTFASNALGHYGRVTSITQLTPLPDVPAKPTWTGVLL